MTVFKYYFKVLKSYLPMIILYTVLLVAFGGINMQTSDNNLSFTATTPDVLVINHDKQGLLAENLYHYIEKHATIKELEDTEESQNDALFYRDINYMITIPKNYSTDFLTGRNPQIEIKQTGDYNASYMDMLLKKYLNTAYLYQQSDLDEQEIISKLNTNLESNLDVEITSKLDTSELSRATFFYNFSNYSLLAGCVFVIASVMNSFKNKNIKKRTVISSMKDSEYNRQLFLGNSIFAVVLWLLYIIVSIILMKETMLSLNGLCYMLNSLLFTGCALSIAFLLGNTVSNKEAINGIVNVIALGSSFLCGAFVPATFLPQAVLTIAHILPSYYFIQNNELIATLETFDWSSLTPLLINGGIILLFIIGFIVLTNIVTRKQRKFG